MHGYYMWHKFLLYRRLKGYHVLQVHLCQNPPLVVGPICGNVLIPFLYSSPSISPPFCCLVSHSYVVKSHALTLVVQEPANVNHHHGGVLVDV